MVFMCQAARRRLSMMAYNGALAFVQGYLPASDACMCNVNGRAAPFAGSRKGTIFDPISKGNDDTR